MAKERGTLEACLSKTMHHVAPHKIGLMAAAGALTASEMRYRFQLVTDDLGPVILKITKIRNAVENGDLEAVKNLLNEDVEFGHNWPE